MRQVICIAATAVSLAFAGCDRGSGSRTNLDPGKGEVDTAALEKSFQTAEPTAKDRANSAVAALKAGKYQEALTQLQGLLSNLKLTPEQKQSVQDAIARIRDKISRGAGEAIDRTKEGGGRVIDDLKKPFEK